MAASLRLHQLWILLLVLIMGTVTACGDESVSAPTSTSPTTSSTADTSTDTSAPSTAPPTLTTTRTAQPAKTPLPPAPPPAAGLPAALVGSWNASTSKSGALELVLAADGGFHQFGGPIDWRGKASVRGARITFTGTDGKSSTEDWSLSGGTLTLAGITYLKADAGAGGTLALVGSWIGLDDIFETLVFNNNGTFERQRDSQNNVGGTFQVQGDSVTLRPAGGAATTVKWSIDNAFLTLGTKQYTRSG